MSSLTEDPLDKLNNVQREIYESFLKEFPDLKIDKYKTLRFLRTCEFNLDKSCDYYRKNLKLRKKYHADSVLNNPPKELLEIHKVIVPHNYHGFDKEGRPILIQKIGQINADLLSECAGIDEAENSEEENFPLFITIDTVLLAHAFDMEIQSKRALDKSKEVGKHIETFVNIIDLNGFAMTHAKFLRYLKAINNYDEVCYPGMLGRTFIINTPVLFYSIWSAIKIFLQPITTSKVTVCSSDYQETLLKYIDSTELPLEYGGKCDSCVPNCIQIYTSEEAKAKMNQFLDSMNIREKIIGSGDSFQVETMIDVRPDKKLKKLIEWKFRTKEHDVKFGAVFIPSASHDKRIVINDLQSVDCHLNVIAGKYLTDQSGILRLTFDNTKSIFRSKSLKYWMQEVSVPQ